MGYTGFDFVRGCEADAYRTDPVAFACPEGDRLSKNERHWRNVHFIRQREEDYFCAQVFQRAIDWLEGNRGHKDFFLSLDIFDPHEPWDPPEEILKLFDPRGYDVPGVTAAAPYIPWRERLSEEQFNAYRARYAAKVVFLDRWLGRFLDALDRLDLWRDTVVIFTTDHGTFNGDHGRIGKLQTHEHDAKAHIPFILAHPTHGHGERRSQLVQLADIYPTVLAAVGRSLPQMPPGRPLHGVNLLPVDRRPGRPHSRFRASAGSSATASASPTANGSCTSRRWPATSRSSGTATAWRSSCPIPSARSRRPPARDRLRAVAHAHLAQRQAERSERAGEPGGARAGEAAGDAGGPPGDAHPAPGAAGADRAVGVG